MELKLVNIAIFNSNLMNNLLIDLRQEFKLDTLCLSKVGLGTVAVDIIAAILKARQPFPKHLDISWNNIPKDGMKKILSSIGHNQYIQSLNIAFNPVCKTDKLRLFGNFVR